MKLYTTLDNANDFEDQFSPDYVGHLKEHTEIAYQHVKEFIESQTYKFENYEFQIKLPEEENVYAIVVWEEIPYRWSNPQINFLIYPRCVRLDTNEKFIPEHDILQQVLKEITIQLRNFALHFSWRIDPLEDPDLEYFEL